MTTDQIILFALLGVVFGLLIWGKIRYDLIAFGALIAALLVGVVPEEDAFSGFGRDLFGVKDYDVAGAPSGGVGWQCGGQQARQYQRNGK